FDPAELAILQANLIAMRSHIHQQHEHALDSSHHGHPVLTEQVYTGRRGRPAIHIDPDFLRWAYSLRSTSSIGRFLHVSRQRVRSALLEHGIALPQADPFIHNREEPDDIPAPARQHTVSFTAPLSTLSDAELDELILRLRRHYCRAGVTMLHGMLLHLGHRIPREWIRLICWGIVIHGFIDGYSQLITGLQASNNNTGQTILDLFLHAAAVYG
ncbi:hypothetical protein L208DRAFT_1016614, partial [Tricholoma matsutake]